ncbi:unnamed protein product [Effrenium voratum]|uniref:Sulfatase N-terminal domain-containing protein n=1 Tax=Effrenium voratum TaxID=2562239 RepID=A0AA36JN13_9DINO|nr:unnamed protein product [Effrenium voratum]
MAQRVAALSFLGVALASAEPGRRSRGSRPNIVFLVVESTDGRAWGQDQQAVPLPHLRWLQDQGVDFAKHYSNAPVCCPSRASFWSGRHVHNIPHHQKSSGIFVEGAWNNHEGLPPNYTLRLDQVLQREGYDVKMTGKLDYSAGGHSEDVYLQAWTMYTRFPYNLSKPPGGWVGESGCVDAGEIRPGNATAHEKDWKVLRKTARWIMERSRDKPFFVYQGMSIVHPPYRTNEFWFNKVDQSRVRVPAWDALEDLHPCDFQSSMLKGCIPPASAVGSDFYTAAHRRKIRTIYLAMIAEFDAMVGKYVEAVQAAGQMNQTVFIVTSDHGDMQMEHQQFYKMAAYEASVRVPMVIMDGRRPQAPQAPIRTPTQLIDIYPTVLVFAGVPRRRWPQLDGFPLQPLLNGKGYEDYEGYGFRPTFVVSQHHGDDIGMSWFAVIRQHLKLVVWGSGQQHPHQLFDVTADPDERVNLAFKPGYESTIQEMLQELSSIVDYPHVAENVAKYGQSSMRQWMKDRNWREELGQPHLRWHQSWAQDPLGAAKAVEDWLAGPPNIQECRADFVWPARALIAI